MFAAKEAMLLIAMPDSYMPPLLMVILEGVDMLLTALSDRELKPGPAQCLLPEHLLCRFSGKRVRARSERLPGQPLP